MTQNESTKHQAPSTKHQAPSTKHQAPSTKRKSILIFISLLCLSSSFAQNIGINSTGNSPAASAALDIDMTNKGLLISRIDLQNLTDVTTIAAPTTSLLVYNTGATLSPKGYYYWDGTVWVPFLTNSAATNAGWSLKGNAGTTVGTHFLGTTDAQDFAIYTSNSERVRVLSGGSVGIGTTAPTQLLHIFKDADFGGTGGSIMYIENPNTTGTLGDAGVIFNQKGQEWFTGIDGSNSSAYRIAPQAEPSTTDAGIVVTTSGNVGIGGATPLVRLDIYETDASNFAYTRMTNLGNGGAAFWAHATGTGNSKILFRTDGPTYWSVGSDHANGDVLKISTSTSLSSGAKVTILRNGNVGIGTTAPTQQFQVYNGSTTGSYTTTGWAHASDRRLKTNIRSIENSLEKVLLLEGVSYNWKNNPNNNKQIGFIAQDVEPILPEVVVKDSEGNYSMVYGNLTAVLVNAIKEQQQLIESQNIKITHLEEKNQKAEHEINTIKQYLGIEAKK